MFLMPKHQFMVFPPERGTMYRTAEIQRNSIRMITPCTTAIHCPTPYGTMNSGSHSLGVYLICGSNFLKRATDAHYVCGPVKDHAAKIVLLFETSKSIA